MTGVFDFAEVGDQYQGYCGTARGRLRHDMVMRKITELCPRPGRALDIGCGDGEISLRLAALGWRVDAFDESEDMVRRARCRASALPAGIARFDRASLAEVSHDAGTAEYDLVCCHGVLMYLPESAPAIRQLALFVKPGGYLSVLTKNGAAVGFREAMKRQYDVAATLIRQAAPASVGHLGVATRGDSAAALEQLLHQAQLSTVGWHGVRIFHDHELGWAPSETEYAAALELEWAAAEKSPFRDVAPLIHILGRR